MQCNYSMSTGIYTIFEDTKLRRVAFPKLSIVGHSSQVCLACSQASNSSICCKFTNTCTTALQATGIIMRALRVGVVVAMLHGDTRN